ncbi:hypothetical protein [Pseudomonas purpurea]|uniref:hypothetical protein n=1 Tax=Pseudomonas purpurea TaxID=3136737 RepID=UPI003267AAF0
MELHFHITPEHTAKRIGILLPHEMHKHDQQSARLQQRTTYWQDRLLSPLLLLLLLVAGFTASYFAQQAITPEKVIANIIFAVGLLWVWRRYSSRWLQPLRQQIAERRTRPHKDFRAINERVIRAKVQFMLSRSEGAYRLLIEDEQLVLSRGKRRASRLAWNKIVLISQCEDFYEVADAALLRKKQVLLIAKHSDDMDPEHYQKGLELLLQKSPVAPGEIVRGPQAPPADSSHDAISSPNGI